MSSKVDGGRVEAPKELVFVKVCVGFVRPGERVVGPIGSELNW